MASVFKRGGKRNPGPWLIKYFNHVGKWVTTSSKTTDNAAAKRIAGKLEAEAALRRQGVIDPHIEELNREGQREVESHIDDFENRLRSARRSELHVLHTLRMLRRIADQAGWKLLKDITADGVNTFAARLADSSDRGTSARTVGKHIAAVKSFTRWLKSQAKLDRDPLVGLTKPSIESDRRLTRRMMLPEEWHQLKIWLSTEAEESHGMGASDRLTLYWLAIETGLRAGEVRTLRRGNLMLDSSQPFVTVAARSTKNRQSAKQFVSADLARSLGELAAAKMPTASIFNLPVANRMARMMRADLNSTREWWIRLATNDPQEYARRLESDFLRVANHSGGQLDFHALRHTCGAWLAKAGERPQVIQAVMRHSTIVLTMGVYGHLFPDDRSGAIGKVQGMVGQRPQISELKATGTDHVGGAHQMRTKQHAKSPIAKRDEITESRTRCDARQKQASGEPGESSGDLRDDASWSDPAHRKSIVVRAGIEPATHGFSVHCSTN